MPAQKPVRRSQLISPFGIGAMVDFPRDESLMTAGLDAWPWALEPCPTDAGLLIREERLEERLGVSHFRAPPEHRDPEGGVRHANVDVPFVRFPLWHYCHHCGGMEEVSPFSATKERCKGRQYEQQSCHAKAERKRPFLIPVRFVCVCDRGHIQDFPFMAWVHRDRPAADDCRLRLRAGRSSAGLTGITIECSCGQRKTLGDVFRFDEDAGGPLSALGCHCDGMRPWLGDDSEGSESCGAHLRVLQRGASNVYFPMVISSLYLPLWAEQVDREIVAALDSSHIWDRVASSTVNGELNEDRCRLVAEICGIDPDRFVAAARRKLRPAESQAPAAVGGEEGFRWSEYRALCDARGGNQTELFVEAADIRNYSPDVARYFSRIQRVHKLRETRVLAGFTRIRPPDGSLASQRLQSLRVDQRIDWLPAVKVYGEGIFLEFSSELLDSWTRDHRRAAQRGLGLVQRLNTARQLRGQPVRALPSKFMVLHTFAHILINQLSFDCGYGSASLRERLYCDTGADGNSMAGILIYTASGDAEGSMGGLVRQGLPRRLEQTIIRAIRNASWCSSDPVCIESTGQGADSANLAACHGCCLLPETSCEEGNRLLDRGVLVGTPEHPDSGFFSPLLLL